MMARMIYDAAKRLWEVFAESEVKELFVIVAVTV